MISSISQFRQSLALPSEHTFISAALVKEIFPFNIIGDDDKQFFKLYFDLVDCDISTRGIVWSLDGLHDLISQVCRVFEVSSQLKEELDNSFTIFAETMTRLPEDHFFKVKPQSQNNVVIFYLSLRRDQILNLTDGQLRWQKLCLPGYLATQLAVESSIRSQKQLWVKIKQNNPKDFIPQTDDQIQEFTRAISKILLNINLSDLSDKGLVKISETAIEVALISANKTGKKFDGCFDSYLKFAKELFQGRQLNRPRFRLVQSRVSEFSLDDIDEYESLSKDEISALEEYTKETNRIFDEDNFAILDESVDADEYDDEETWLTINSEAIDDGESEDESSPPPTDSEKFNLRRGMAERNRRLQPIAWTPFWDKSLCTQETLGCLLAHLFDLSREEEETPGEYFELLVIVLFQIFFGFATKNLIRIRFKKKTVPSADKTNPIIYHRGCFYIHPEKYDHKPLFGATDSLYAKSCLPGGHSFQIAIPPLLRILIEKKLSLTSSSSGFLFSPQASAINEYDLAVFSKKLLLIKNLFSEKINFNKISRTSINHFSAKAGLDSLLAAFISGFVPQHLGAQGHYFNISQSEISDLHAHACRIIWEQIKESSKATIATRGLSSLTEIENYFCEVSSQNGFEAANFSPDFKDEILPLRFGSPFVPIESETRDYLAGLGNIFTGSISSITRFNAFTVYTALSLMHLAGLRGIELERLNIKKIQFESDGAATVIVIGKSNKRFTEWRLAYVPAPFSKILSEYIKKAEEISEYLLDESLAYRAEINRQRGDSPLFFVDESGDVVPLTRKNLKKQITVTLPDQTGCKKYPWKINAPRQLFAFSAYNLGISRRLIDALMGHSSQGMEPLACFSGLAFDEFKAAAGQVTSKIASNLNIKLQGEISFK